MVVDFFKFVHTLTLFVRVCNCQVFSVRDLGWCVAFHVTSVTTIVLFSISFLVAVQ